MDTPATVSTLTLQPGSLAGVAARAEWRARRQAMEQTRRRHTRRGVALRNPVPELVGMVVPFLRAIGLGERGLANAQAVQVTETELFFPHLPPTFDGYSIAHLTDLHVGRVPGLMDRVLGHVRGRNVDLAVMTGDYQSRGTPAAAAVAAEMAPLIAALDPHDGVYGVLGNHDTHDLVDALEGIGMRMLVNEHAAIARDGESIRLTGIDDVNRYYTGAAEEALSVGSAGQFSIALVHSAEIADIAAASGYALYLSGHTHGGQICLPGGRPVITALDHHHRLASGPWQWDGMLGYTSRGVGVKEQARFNCPPEIVILRLRCEPYAVLPP